MFSSLEFWDDHVERDPAGQMAADEALLHCAVSPSVRIYRWAAPAATFGYSQKISEVRPRVGERPAVRRWTGGGIVLHGDDLTIALAIPASFTPRGVRAGEVYRSIHGALLKVLGEGCSEARLALPADCQPGPACFEAPALNDIIALGRKIGGGALRRVRTGVLYQGSLQSPWEVGADAICTAFSPVVRKVRETSRMEQLAALLHAEKYGTTRWNLFR